MKTLKKQLMAVYFVLSMFSLLFMESVTIQTMFIILANFVLCTRLANKTVQICN